MIDKGSFTWTALPPLSTPRQALASAATGGHVYALGGSWSATRSSVVATVEMFDVGTEQWVAWNAWKTEQGGGRMGEW